MSESGRIKDVVANEVKQMPLYKKVIAGGGLLFLVACLFPPVKYLLIKSSSFSHYDFIFSIDSRYDIAWSILAVELVAIVVVTAMLAFALKKN